MPEKRVNKQQEEQASASESSEERKMGDAAKSTSARRPFPPSRLEAPKAHEAPLPRMLPHGARLNK